MYNLNPSETEKVREYVEKGRAADGFQDAKQFAAGVKRQLDMYTDDDARVQFAVETIRVAGITNRTWSKVLSKEATNAYRHFRPRYNDSILHSMSDQAKSNISPQFDKRRIAIVSKDILNDPYLDYDNLNLRYHDNEVNTDFLNAITKINNLRMYCEKFIFDTDNKK